MREFPLNPAHDARVETRTWEEIDLLAKSFGSYATYAQPDSPDAYCMEMTYVIGLPDITTANQTSTEVLEKVKAHAKRNEPGMAWLEVYRAIKGLSHKKDIPNEIETLPERTFSLAVDWTVESQIRWFKHRSLSSRCMTYMGIQHPVYIYLSNDDHSAQKIMPVNTEKVRQNIMLPYKLARQRMQKNELMLVDSHKQHPRTTNVSTFGEIKTIIYNYPTTDKGWKVLVNHHCASYADTILSRFTNEQIGQPLVQSDTGSGDVPKVETLVEKTRRVKMWIWTEIEHESNLPSLHLSLDSTMQSLDDLTREAAEQEISTSLNEILNCGAIKPVQLCATWNKSIDVSSSHSPLLLRKISSQSCRDGAATGIMMFQKTVLARASELGLTSETIGTSRETGGQSPVTYGRRDTLKLHGYDRDGLKIRVTLRSVMTPRAVTLERSEVSTTPLIKIDYALGL
ncbi:hypothetical protein M231_07620 [Tremella mesenterica]|uniref:Uncharacterized protein n=1 Tax=Tremella mesenterica TaxID=5217 RepID=A0A4Q1BAS6_TREME|nr:hypothetical protein M231_07620 [Tremella mesenterica]